MAFRLDGRRALVMGGSRGIGLGIARAFAEAGAAVAVTGRKQEDAGDAARSIGKSAFGFALDTADLNQIDSVHAEAARALGGGIDILVLNSGGPPPGPAMGVSSENWQQYWTMMFVGLVRMADLALPGMIERRFGRVMSVVSSSVIQPIPNLGMSNAIRPAIVGWGKTVSNEVARFGVTVNAIAPGRIQTERVDRIDQGAAAKTGKTHDQIRTEAMGRIPVGRYGTIEEFGAAALFLASNEASFTTGSIIRVDGGQISSI
ncbi:MAG: SDR family oxidoreductase [Methylocystis sp.]|nr:SDR family oxidoreductase [Methylocystis sp.]MCA3583141.1 SDR family oxidoreductase [Methylocystis sp.]MCA3587654.1 SDR family oxidoreductase [Methylocystis sp.]MCA3590781.1 SDR family oxidoreductase [Methylocystis sp.]